MSLRAFMRCHHRAFARDACAMMMMRKGNHKDTKSTMKDEEKNTKARRHEEEKREDRATDFTEHTAEKICDTHCCFGNTIIA